MDLVSFTLSVPLDALNDARKRWSDQEIADALTWACHERLKLLANEATFTFVEHIGYRFFRGTDDVLWVAWFDVAKSARVSNMAIEGPKRRAQFEHGKRTITVVPVSEAVEYLRARRVKTQEAAAAAVPLMDALSREFIRKTSVP